MEMNVRTSTRKRHGHRDQNDLQDPSLDIIAIQRLEKKVAVHISVTPTMAALLQNIRLE